MSFKTKAQDTTNFSASFNKKDPKSDPNWTKGVARESYLNEPDTKPGRERLLPVKKEGKMKNFTALVKAAAIAESIQGGMSFPSCSQACANVCACPFFHRDPSE